MPAHVCVFLYFRTFKWRCMTSAAFSQFSACMAAATSSTHVFNPTISTVRSSAFRVLACAVSSTRTLSTTRCTTVLESLRRRVKVSASERSSTTSGLSERLRCTSASTSSPCSASARSAAVDADARSRSSRSWPSMANTDVTMMWVPRPCHVTNLRATAHRRFLSQW